MEKLCKQCGSVVVGRVSRAIFCSDKCKRDFHNHTATGKRLKKEYDSSERGIKRGKEWVINNKMKRQETWKKYYRKIGHYKLKLKEFRKYNTTEEIYRGMVEAQHNCCAICGTFLNSDSKSNSPTIDHNHSTGELRGILCGKCNCGLGFFKDTPDNLMRAATYLLSRGYYG